MEGYIFDITVISAMDFFTIFSRRFIPRKDPNSVMLQHIFLALHYDKMVMKSGASTSRHVTK